MKTGLSFSLVFAVACILFTGCDVNPAKTIDRTDSNVYKIIDSAWQEDIGTKANYKIRPPGSEPNVIDVNEIILPSGVLTLPGAVAIATASNRQYNTEKENLYLTALDLTEVRHLYQPNPFAGGQGGFRKDGSNKGTGAEGSLGIQQLLATGAQIGTNVSLGWVDIISGDMRSGFATVATATITQPLLRGAGRKVALENLTQAEHNVLYQIRTFNRYRQDFVTSIITEYWLVLQQNDKWINACDYYDALAEIHTDLQKRAAAGRIPLYECDQANQDRLRALSDYVQARKDYKNILDAFKMQLAIAPNTDFYLDAGELDVLRQSVSQEIKLSEKDGIEIALNQRLDLANAADKALDAERKVDVAADAIRAELNLIGYANPQSPGKTTFGADPGQLQSTQDRYQLSLQLDLPIDRLAEKNAYRRALITLMQQQRAHQELTDSIILQVRKAWRQMQETHRQYNVECQAYELAEQRAGNVSLLLQYDRANTRDVLDANKDFLRARDAVTEALVSYTIATLNFYRDTGLLQVRQDGMWQRADIADKKPLPDDLPVEESLSAIEPAEKQLQTEQTGDPLKIKTTFEDNDQSEIMRILNNISDSLN